MLQNLRMRLKVALLLGLMTVSLVAISAIGLSTLRDTLLEDRKKEIEAIIHASLSVAGHYQAKIEGGELSKEDGIKQYYDSMSKLRFEGNAGYLFAYNPDGIMQMHGAAPHLIGKDLSSMQDSKTGAYIVKEMIASARGEGLTDGQEKGHFTYYWNKPKQPKEKLFEKFAYSGVLPWGDIIGTGLYTDDLDKVFWGIATNVGIVSAIALGVALLVGFAISKDISGSLLKLQGSMNNISGGDYSTDVAGEQRRDELGDMARTVLEFREQIKENEELRVNQERLEREGRETRRQETLDLADNLENRVKSLVERIGQSISNLHNAASNMNRIADESSQRSNDVAAATEETSANVETVAAATEELTASSDEISVQVNNSTQVANEASTQVEMTNQTVDGLAKAIDKIGDVVSLIDAITEQTNLLALNATIEAARAGEAGKGFAVVASEVRNLANQTAQATAEIGTQIKAVQAESENALGAVNQISSTITGVAENSTAIAAAIEEQHAAIREIARNVNQASDGTRTVSQHISEVSKNANETSSATEVVTTSADELVSESEALETEVETFLSELRVRANQI